MRKLITLVLELLPCMAFAATDCRIVDYTDHFEAICVGESLQTTAATLKADQEQNDEVSQTAESNQAEVPPEKIVRNELARLHMASWLKTRPGQ